MNFTKSYIAAGLLAPGRAIVLVNAGWGGTGFGGVESGAPNSGGESSSAPYAYPFPSPNTSLILCWAPNVACNAGVYYAANATAALQAAPARRPFFAGSLSLSVPPPPPSDALAMCSTRGV